MTCPTCPRCEGTGYMHKVEHLMEVLMMPRKTRLPCPDCNGTGLLPGRYAILPIPEDTE